MPIIITILKSKGSHTCSFLLFILSACKTNNSPSTEKMKECLSNELANKAVIMSYEQQDGLTKIKDGVKYYEGYFNAEVKFIANTASFNAGQRCKIIKATLSFIETEKGWNCQSFDINSSNIVLIKEQPESIVSVNGVNNVENDPKQVASKSQTTTQLNDEEKSPSQNTEPISYTVGNYIANGNENRKIYFHNTANNDTRRKAYISTQEEVYVQNVENGFGYIEFTNSSGTTSYGWVEMKYLISKPE